MKSRNLKLRVCKRKNKFYYRLMTKTIGKGEITPFLGVLQVKEKSKLLGSSTAHNLELCKNKV
jgi:hypothetical protein